MPDYKPIQADRLHSWQTRTEVHPPRLAGHWARHTTNTKCNHKQLSGSPQFLSTMTVLVQDHFYSDILNLHDSSQTT